LHEILKIFSEPLVVLRNLRAWQSDWEIGMASMNRFIIALLLFSSGAAVFAQATTRIEEKFWTEYIYSQTADSRAEALKKLQKRIAVEQLVTTFKDFKAVPNTKQDTAADLRELSQLLGIVVFNLTDFPEALTLAHLQGTLPPAKEDHELLRKDLELCRQLLTAISILSDIRAPGTQISLRGNDSVEIQGCAMQSARLARAVYFLGVAKRDDSYLNLGREVWTQCWNMVSGENRKWMLKLPTEENSREVNADDPMKAYLEILNSKYPNPNAKAPLPEQISGALSPEQFEKYEKQIAQLKTDLNGFYESWNKGDTISLDKILAKDCKDRDALIAIARDENRKYEIDDQTRINAGDSDNANATLFVSRVKVKGSGKETRDFRSLHIIRFKQSDGQWRIVEFER
jgi:hypothetical protein